MNWLIIRRNIYIIIGSFLVLLNVLVDILDFEKLASKVLEFDSFNFGYLIGSHFLLLFGLVFLRLAYKTQARIKKKKAEELEKAINEIGQF